jgi:hypothetical protein
MDPMDGKVKATRAWRCSKSFTTAFVDGRVWVAFAVPGLGLALPSTATFALTAEEPKESNQHSVMPTAIDPEIAPAVAATNLGARGLRQWWPSLLVMAGILVWFA